jgi:hypothetical protein
MGGGILEKKEKKNTPMPMGVSFFKNALCQIFLP